MPKTEIEWTDHSWPVVNGCRRVSAGCQRCYAERLASTRLSKTEKYRGLAVFKQSGPQWTGETRLWPKELGMPLRLRKPSRIFVADMGDLFYEGVSDETIAAVFGVMAAAPKHVFQVLTKRPERARQWFDWVGRDLTKIVNALWPYQRDGFVPSVFFREGAPVIWPLPNVHIGTSVENQETANLRVPQVLEVPAAKHFVSYEPALGPLDLEYIVTEDDSFLDALDDDPESDRIDWVICGAESGPRARPFNEDWARIVRDQCVRNGVAFFYKQSADARGRAISTPLLDGKRWTEFPTEVPCS